MATALAPRALLALSAVACVQPVAEGQLAPEFELVDLNPTSATYDQAISPSDYRGQVSAWYFTHST